jgi:hypothetical protein
LKPSPGIFTQPPFDSFTDTPDPDAQVTDLMSATA